MRPTSLLIVLACLLGPGALAAQETQAASAGATPELRAHRLGEEVDVDLDGRLTEDAWSRADAVTDFTQVEPVEGGEPTERTEVRVVYDDDALYIGAMLYDDPEGILAYQKRRDAGLGTDDRFMWILDTFRDGRTGYFFEINAAGLMGDGLLGGGGHFGVQKSWDGIWEAQVERLENGWSAEIRIPFSTLNFNPEADTWGINFQRTIRRRNEEIRWSGWRQNQRLFDPVFAGRLEGIRDVSQGIGLEFTPYAVQNWRETVADDDPTSFPGDVGFDLGYSITPSLRAAASVNTDFAEVEVDQRRVNLTRFPLFFPERRDFFLEGSGVYSFAPRSGPRPYFSRRIGLRNGQPVPIEVAGRLGGQAGPYELGFLQVHTGQSSGFASEDFTVARVRRRILDQSTIGAIYTRRATADGPDDVAPLDRHTVGADLDYATSRLFGDQNFEMEAFLVWNSDDVRDADRSFGDLTARGFRFNYPNDIWEAHVSYREFGPAYDPAVGFVRRNDFRRVEPRIAWNPRPQSVSWIRQVGFSTQFRYLESLTQDQVEERRWDLGLLELDFESGDRLELQANHLYELLDFRFEVSDGVPILPGEYRNWEYSAQFRSASRRKVSVNAEVSRGGFWDGDRTGLQLGLDLRPLPGLSFSVDYNRNEVELPRGEFATNLFRLNNGWELSPWTSFRGTVQYDDVSNVLGLFGLFRWIVSPGNEVFLVYQHNWLRLEGDDPLDREFATLTRGASAKVTYSWRW